MWEGVQHPYIIWVVGGRCVPKSWMKIAAKGRKFFGPLTKLALRNKDLV